MKQETSSSPARLNETSFSVNETQQARIDLLHQITEQREAFLIGTVLAHLVIVNAVSNPKTLPKSGVGNDENRENILQQFGPQVSQHLDTAYGLAAKIQRWKDAEIAANPPPDYLRTVEARERANEIAGIARHEIVEMSRQVNNGFKVVEAYLRAARESLIENERNGLIKSEEFQTLKKNFKDMTAALGGYLDLNTSIKAINAILTHFQSFSDSVVSATAALNPRKISKVLAGSPLVNEQVARHLEKLNLESDCRLPGKRMLTPIDRAFTAAAQSYDCLTHLRGEEARIVEELVVRTLQSQRRQKNYGFATPSNVQSQAAKSVEETSLLMEELLPLVNSPKLLEHLTKSLTLERYCTIGEALKGMLGSEAQTKELLRKNPAVLFLTDLEVRDLQNSFEVKKALLDANRYALRESGEMQISALKQNMSFEVLQTRFRALVESGLLPERGLPEILTALEEMRAKELAEQKRTREALFLNQHRASERSPEVGERNWRTAQLMSKQGS